MTNRQIMKLKKQETILRKILGVY